MEREGLEDGGGGGWLLEGSLVEVVKTASLLEHALEDVVFHRSRDLESRERERERIRERRAGEEVGWKLELLSSREVGRGTLVILFVKAIRYLRTRLVFESDKKEVSCNRLARLARESIRGWQRSTSKLLKTNCKCTIFVNLLTEE